jgi:hypothetical protein
MVDRTAMHVFVAKQRLGDSECATEAADVDVRRLDGDDLCW